MPAQNLTASIPRLFRSYSVPKHQSDDCAIWEAARATCASSPFFKPVEIGVSLQREIFIGGDVGCNNPTLQLLHQAALIYPENFVSCVISIGAGQAQPISTSKVGYFQHLSDAVQKAMVNIASDCEHTAHEVAKRFEQQDDFYLRFNVAQGLQSIRGSHWERLSEVVTHTKQYIETVDVDKQISSAQNMLHHRPAIFKTTSIIGRLLFIRFCLM